MIPGECIRKFCISLYLTTSYSDLFPIFRNKFVWVCGGGTCGTSRTPSPTENQKYKLLHCRPGAADGTGLRAIYSIYFIFLMIIRIICALCSCVRATTWGRPYRMCTHVIFGGYLFVWYII